MILDNRKSSNKRLTNPLIPSSIETEFILFVVSFTTGELMVVTILPTT